MGSRQPTTATGQTARSASAARRRMFRGLCVVLPIALPLAGEAACRLRGYGGRPPIIRKVGDHASRTWHATNRAGIASFFQSNVGGVGGMRELAFTTPKAPDTVRIAFIGDSAMQGFPQPAPLTNGAFLEAMLNDVWAGRRRAEVLNLGCTAVASFVELEILKEALNFDLDLVVIMAGNNEYFGAYGVASMHGAGTSPSAMRFTRWTQDLALAQWFDARRARRTSPDEDPGRVLMERVAAVGQIGPDHPLRAAARHVARTHLAEMVRLARARGVQVMVCTLPTNERDLLPIGADVPPAASGDRRDEFDRLLRNGEAELDANPEAATAALRDALAIWDRHARAHYLLARALSASGRGDEALREYVVARDLDTMPWRATSDTNDAARAAAAGNPGVLLCDMEAGFRAASTDGAIGWELLDDHVHLSLRGQALFAEIVAHEMARLPDPLRVDPERLTALPGWEAYADRLGRNVYDEYASALHVKRLFDTEFMRLTNPAAKERTDTRIAEIRSRIPHVDHAALDLWAAEHMTFDRPITAVAGVQAKSRGEFAHAAECFRIAARCSPPASLWKLQYTVERLSCRRRLNSSLDPEDQAEARAAIETAELLARFAELPNPAGTASAGLAYHYAGQPQQAIPLLEEAIRLMSGAAALDVMEALTEALVRTEQVDSARTLLRMAQNDPFLRGPASRVLAAPPFAPPAP